MSRQAKNLFIPSSFQNNPADADHSPGKNRYTQVIHALAYNLHAKESLDNLAKQLGSMARHAWLAGEMDAVQQASELVLALPVKPELKAVGRIYQALCLKNAGDLGTARRILECVVDEAAPSYKARALQGIAGTYYGSGEVDLALPFYVAAGKAALGHDPCVLVESQRMIAAVYTAHGLDRLALRTLEELFPLVSAVSRYFGYGALLFDYYNSLAVKLGNVGNIDQAKAALSIALNSPYASAYPNWAETREELEAKRIAATPSVVAVHCDPMPDAFAESSAEADAEREAGRLESAEPRDRSGSGERSDLAAGPAPIKSVQAIKTVLDQIGETVQSRAPPTLSDAATRILN